MNNEFFKYATKHVGLNTLGLEQYISKINNSGYISPTVIEERQLNVAQMDPDPFRDGTRHRCHAGWFPPLPQPARAL